MKSPLIKTKARVRRVSSATAPFRQAYATVANATAAFLKDGDPGAFEYRFRREVDFGSAACMLVRAGLFLEVGGFDELFSPAYALAKISAAYGRSSAAASG